MQRFLLWSIFISSLLGVVFCSPQAVPERREKSLTDILPAVLPDGWKSSGEAEEYAGDDLFLYINGGAEIYHEFGFSRVIVQDYTLLNERSITLEIYEMKRADGAFGMYTFKTTPEGDQLDIGSRASLEDYYLNFWEGRYLVTLTGFDEDPVTIQGLQKIAAEVAENITDSASEPPLVSLLPAAGLNAAGVKYFQGPLALFNSYRFFTDEVPSLHEGIRGDYAGGYSLFIFSHSGEQPVEEIFARLRDQFERDPRYAEFTRSGENTLWVLDQDGKQLVICYYRSYTIILLGVKEQEQVQHIYEEVTALIKERALSG